MGYPSSSILQLPHTLVLLSLKIRCIVLFYKKLLVTLESYVSRLARAFLGQLLFWGGVDGTGLGFISE